MNNDLNTPQTASLPLLMGADRKDPPEKWVLPMVRSFLATSISPWATANSGADCRDWLKEGVYWWRKEFAAYTKDCFKQA